MKSNGKSKKIAQGLFTKNGKDLQVGEVYYLINHDRTPPLLGIIYRLILHTKL